MKRIILFALSIWIMNWSFMTSSLCHPCVGSCKWIWLISRDVFVFDIHTTRLQIRDSFLDRGILFGYLFGLFLRRGSEENPILSVIRMTQRHLSSFYVQDLIGASYRWTCITLVDGYLVWGCIAFPWVIANERNLLWGKDPLGFDPNLWTPKMFVGFNIGSIGYLTLLPSCARYHHNISFRCIICTFCNEQFL